MDIKDQLAFCKICSHQENNIQHGILCNLTHRKPDFEFRCTHFKKDITQFEKIEDNLNQEITFNKELSLDKEKPVSESNPNKHITLWILLASVLIIIKLSFEYKKIQKNKVLIDDFKKEKLYNERELSKKTNPKKKQQKAIYYLVNKNRVKIKRKKVIKDTSFMVAKRLKLVIHKKYYMSIVNNDELPVLAIYRGYSFTYNKVLKNKSQSLSEQWIEYRRILAPKIKVFDVKKYEFEGMKIEEKNFVISGARKIYGVAKLIEIDDERFFFHYFFKQEFEDYHMLRKYLNYYVKLK